MNNISVKLANKEDAKALYELNEEFNGKGLNSVDFIEKSLENNKQEIVCVADFNGESAGFCCAQIKKSMCYTSNYAELTELFIKNSYRRKGIATTLIKFIEGICSDIYKVGKFQLLTGKDNLSAQQLYESLGYRTEDEILFVKQII